MIYIVYTFILYIYCVLYIMILFIIKHNIPDIFLYLTKYNIFIIQKSYTKISGLCKYYILSNIVYLYEIDIYCI